MGSIRRRCEPKGGGEGVEFPIGVLCPAGPDDVPPGLFAQKAEALGFESIWVGEHPAIPCRIDRPYEQLVGGEVPYFYTNIADPWMTLAHVAGATVRILHAASACSAPACASPASAASTAPRSTRPPLLTRC